MASYAFDWDHPGLAGSGEQGTYGTCGVCEEPLDSYREARDDGSFHYGVSCTADSQHGPDQVPTRTATSVLSA